MVLIAGNEIVCENGILHLECMDNEVINLSEANYGRTIKGGVCHCQEGTSIDAGNCPNNPVWSNVDNCFSSNSLSILKNTCNGNFTRLMNCSGLPRARTRA